MIAAQQSCGNKTPTQHLVGLGNFEEPGAVVSQRESWVPKISTPENNMVETQISGWDFPLWRVENHAQIDWTIMRFYPAIESVQRKSGNPVVRTGLTLNTGSKTQRASSLPSCLLPTQWPIDFWWSQTASKRPPGLCASSFVLIYPRSSVDISRNHPEGLSMLACMTIGWADTDQFSWSHRFWPLSWKQNTFSYYTTL